MKEVLRITELFARLLAWFLFVVLLIVGISYTLMTMTNDFFDEGLRIWANIFLIAFLFAVVIYCTFRKEVVIVHYAYKNRGIAKALSAVIAKKKDWELVEWDSGFPLAIYRKGILVAGIPDINSARVICSDNRYIEYLTVIFEDKVFRKNSGGVQVLIEKIFE